MQNNKKIIIWVIMLMAAIGCSDKRPKDNNIKPINIQNQDSEKETAVPLTQPLNYNPNRCFGWTKNHALDSIFRVENHYSISDFLIPPSIGNPSGTLLLKQHYNQDQGFTTVDNYTYTNDGLLFRKVDLATAIKSDRRVGRLYTGKYLGESIPCYKHYLPKAKWQAAESIIESFGWVHFEYSEYYNDIKLLGKNRMLPITINEKVKELLKQGVLSCYYENDNLVQFEYFDRLFDPSNSDSTFYFEFLVNKPHLYIQKVPSLVASFTVLPAKSSVYMFCESTELKGWYYKNKQIISTTDARELNKEDNIEAQLLIKDYYEPLIDFIQEANKQYKF